MKNGYFQTYLSVTMNEKNKWNYKNIFSLAIVFFLTSNNLTMFKNDYNNLSE